ncbi:MAG: sigma-70 family RNA polymerase sigma factor [Acidobacteria bacterium]|nr:MAG: sigma-70 family RNA polymerase sigma factor [Acidobacteriota bacterium]
MAESGAKLFEESHASIEEALRYVAFRRRLPPIELQELRSYVSLKLIENDYARLRKQSAEGSMSAYLHVVIQRLYLDHQIGKWGKWHASAEARRRGEIAVQLERLIYRDGNTVQEAVEQLRGMSHVYASREDLLRLAYALPVRHRPRFVSDDQACGCGTTVAVDPIERLESEVGARRLQAELTQAMRELNREDRRLLKMRFSERRTVPEIAANLDVDAKPLYARIRRLLARIRGRLESGEGLGGREAESYLAMTARTIDLDEVFAHAV